MIIHGYLEGNVLILTVNYKLKEGKRDEFVKRLGKDSGAYPHGAGLYKVRVLSSHRQGG